MTKPRPQGRCTLEVQAAAQQQHRLQVTAALVSVVSSLGAACRVMTYSGRDREALAEFVDRCARVCMDEVELKTRDSS